MPEQFEKYLKPTRIIDCDSDSIQEQAYHLTHGKNNASDRAVALFYFVRDEIRYTMYLPRFLPQHFKASAVLRIREGYCVQKSVLLAALARAAGIPAALGFSRLRNNLMSQRALKWLGTDVLPFHGYTSLYLNGKWLGLTPAFDIHTCESNGIIPVEFDGAHDAMLSACSNDGRLQFEYVGDLGNDYADLPLGELLNARPAKLKELDEIYLISEDYDLLDGAFF